MTASSIAIIDYGMGNLHSVASAVEHVSPDSKVIITADQRAIESADRVIFPGVGAIRDCMAEIRRLGFDVLVPQIVADGKPVLAICVGMQALMTRSEENGGVDCIDLLPGQVRFFANNLKDPSGQRLKVPHMGWNQVKQTIDHPLWQGIADHTRFYFVHSYYVAIDNNPYVSGRCDYGHDVVASLSKANVFATQFHPEKSHTAGLQLLKNFVHWRGQL